MKKPFRKGDLWLLGGVLLVALSLLLCRTLFARQGALVSVSVNGDTVKVFNVTDDVSQYIEGVGGQNHIRIENGQVWIDDADCPQGICQHHAPISHVGDSIICLPHRLTVTILGESDTPDAVVS